MSVALQLSCSGELFQDLTVTLHLHRSRVCPIQRFSATCLSQRGLNDRTNLSRTACKNAEKHLQRQGSPPAHALQPRVIDGPWGCIGPAQTAVQHTHRGQESRGGLCKMGVCHSDRWVLAMRGLGEGNVVAGGVLRKVRRRGWAFGSSTWRFMWWRKKRDEEGRSEMNTVL